MEYSGLLPKYDVNRKLTEQELSLQLKQGQRLGIEPLYQLSVISMNSTFLESVDKWFAWKGMLSIVTFGFLGIFGVRFGGGALDYFLQGVALVHTENDPLEMLLNGVGMLIVVAAVVWVLCWILCKESFAYTHYPIRFDRESAHGARVSYQRQYSQRALGQGIFHTRRTKAVERVGSSWACVEE